ncbi:MAG: tetratricopeptide repeat protein [Blastocatellia bacterium]|nr:tetratricopeptide repeat protein [Blastocatellia bacterium]
MEVEKLIQAVQELVGSQSPEEMQAVFQRHPDLLEESSIETLLSLAEGARNAGETETADALESMAGFLAQLSQGLAEGVASDEQGITQIDISPESSVPWARLARQYLSLRREEYLEQAIAEAQDFGEMEIVSMLEALQSTDIQTIDEYANRLFDNLMRSGRSEEGLTVGLVGLDMRAWLTEMFINFPPDQQGKALGVGLQACKQAVSLAKALGDEACQAFYMVMEGGGYARGRRMEEAEEAYREGLAIRRKLAQLQPQVYEPYVAGTLNNLGNVLRDLRRMEEAEEAYREGLELCRRNDTPVQMVKTLSGLGDLLMKQESWHEATEALNEAMEQVELLRAEVLGLDRRMQILRENVSVYERLLICLMKLERHLEAIEIAERGKGRTLNDLLTLRDLRPKNAPLETVQEYERLLVEARALEERLQRGDVLEAGAQGLPPKK